MSRSIRSLDAPTSLQRLERSDDWTEQVEALKRIKNELVGHETRKVEYIRHGIIPLVSKTLSTCRIKVNGTASITWGIEQETVCIHAANLISLIAHEGPAFVQPLLEGQTLLEIISNLVLSGISQATLALLKCLNAIADNLPPSKGGQWLPDSRLADLLFSKQYIKCLRTILENATNLPISQQVCNTAIALLCKTCSQEWHKRAATEVGVLHALSKRLASFVVSEGLVLPNLDVLDVSSPNSSNLPEPAPESARLSPVLEAIAALIERSKFRAGKFLGDPIISTVLPPPRDNFSPSDIRKAPWGGSYFSGAAVPRSHTQNPLDSLLPFVPTSEKLSGQGQSSFPPLSSVTPMPKRRSSFLPTTMEPPKMSMFQETTDESEESSVIPWLLFVARESNGKRRLLATRLLVALHNLQLVKRIRSQSFAALLVPPLVRMLDKDQVKPEDHVSPGGSYLCTGMHYTKAVPAVLAVLIMDDPDMQKVAVDAKAIVKLSNGLKTTFESALWYKAVAWRPYKTIQEEFHEHSLETSLGPGGPTPRMRQDMAYREGTLQSLAAIAPFNDEYRKEICDQGVVVQIMQALEPFQSSNLSSSETQKTLSGNSASTILAACGAVRALTRSVTALRTKLVDAEVAKAIIRLMNNNDPEVRIAATKVLANLAMDFSPMKDSIGETAVVKKLCEQAHSANARLRLESIWALKQLVVNASKKLKQDVVDELGPSWIKLLIKTDPHDIPENEVIGLVERDYPPRSRYDSSIESVDTAEDVLMVENSESEIAQTRSSTKADEEMNFARHTVADDLAIQEQLLDLIRNLFCGENASELVEYLLKEIGRDDFFKILLDRLKPRTSPGPTRKENHTSPASPGIVVKVLYIVIHVAACNHIWRNIIATQQTLIKHILTFCTHTDEEIRAQCCWLVINLTYEDDASDRPACKQRALELHRLGYSTQLRRLEMDPKLNVRERAKTAAHLMRQHVES